MPPSYANTATAQVPGDLEVIELGTLVARPGFSNKREIWPVGYRAEGSLVLDPGCPEDFRVEVDDGAGEAGEGPGAGPVFRVIYLPDQSAAALAGQEPLLPEVVSEARSGSGAWAAMIRARQTAHLREVTTSALARGVQTFAEGYLEDGEEAALAGECHSLLKRKAVLQVEPVMANYFRARGFAPATQKHKEGHAAPLSSRWNTRSWLARATNPNLSCLWPLSPAHHFCPASQAAFRDLPSSLGPAVAREHQAAAAAAMDGLSFTLSGSALAAVELPDRGAFLGTTGNALAEGLDGALSCPGYVFSEERLERRRAQEVSGRRWLWLPRAAERSKVPV